MYHQYSNLKKKYHKKLFKIIWSFHWVSEREKLREHNLPVLLQTHTSSTYAEWKVDTVHVNSADLVPPHKHYSTNITQQQMWEMSSMLQTPVTIVTPAQVISPTLCIDFPIK
jgi:hypothetical protein